MGDLAMTQKQIQVGIVGASAQKNWAHLSHIPAINGLPGHDARSCGKVQRRSQVLQEQISELSFLQGLAETTTTIRSHHADLSS